MSLKNISIIEAINFLVNLMNAISDAFCFYVATNQEKKKLFIETSLEMVLLY